MDEAEADDGALHRFFAFWVRYRLRRGAIQRLDTAEELAQVLAIFEAEEPTP